MKHRRVVGSSARYAQRGDLWKAFRRTMITGSVAGVLVHRGKKDTTTKSEIFKSYTDKAYVRRESDVGTLNMSYGTNQEKRAIQHYLKMIETNYLTNYPGSSVSVTHEDVDFYIHSSGMLMASPDSEITVTVNLPDGSSHVERGVLEVKTPTSTYFGKLNVLKDPTRPITYSMFRDLLPTKQITNRKYGPPHFPAPRLNIHKKQGTTDLYRDYSTDDANFGPYSEYSQYYFQVIANLFLSGREWADFAVWTDPTEDKDKKSHSFYYKDATDPYRSLHVERFYASDPQVQRDYEVLMEAVKSWTATLKDTLKANVESFLLAISEDGEEPITLPELTAAEEERGEVDCPEEGVVVEE